MYDICLSEENRRRAIHDVKRSKRIRKILIRENISDDELLYKSYYWIINYENAEHTPITIKDGMTNKERSITVPTLEELVVQHCVINALKPVFIKGMYEHSYASIPKRGAHRGKKVIEKWIRRDPKNTRYILKIDIHHFFDSIPHDILKEKLSLIIKDEQMLQLVYKIIDLTEIGLPLGFYTSQWFSNWYLQESDHFIKEKLHVKYYIRYMDDMVMFGRNKRTLHSDLYQVKLFLKDNLGLELKNNYQVFLFDYDECSKDLDFMGFRFFRNRTILRKQIMLKATRKAKKIYKKIKFTIYDARQMLSYLGWVKATNTYQMYCDWIKQYLSFKELKNYVSKIGKIDSKRIYLKLVKLYS